MLEKFNTWFGSAAGVWQTLLVTLGWVAWEHLHPGMDPNGFLLLYVLTVYSGVTQPILAYGNNVSARKMEEMLGHIENIVEHLEVARERAGLDRAAGGDSQLAD